MKEDWRPVYPKEYSDLYYVSNKGEVFSVISEKMMTHIYNNANAPQVFLTKNGKTKKFLVNRLVFFSFYKVKNKENYVISRKTKEGKSCLDNLEINTRHNHCLKYCGKKSIKKGD